MGMIVGQYSDDLGLMPDKNMGNSPNLFFLKIPVEAGAYLKERMTSVLHNKDKIFIYVIVTEVILQKPYLIYNLS